MFIIILAGVGGGWAGRVMQGDTIRPTQNPCLLSVLEDAVCCALRSPPLSHPNKPLQFGYKGIFTSDTYHQSSNFVHFFTSSEHTKSNSPKRTLGTSGCISTMFLP